MKPLISTNSVLYKKRLVRELNGLFDGFYYQGMRCNRAKYVNNKIWIRKIGGHTFYDVVDDNFFDCYGRSIIASQKP